MRKITTIYAVFISILFTCVSLAGNANPTVLVKRSAEIAAWESRLDHYWTPASDVIISMFSNDGEASVLSIQKVNSFTRITTVASGDWNDATIWSTGSVPSSTDSAEITSGNTVTINVTNAVCATLDVKGTLEYSSTTKGVLVVGNSVKVYSSGSFTAGSGTLTTHTLSIGGTNNNNTQGNLTVDGTFDMKTTASATVTFFGKNDAAISGSGSTCDFANIVVNKGTTQTPLLDVTRVITLATPTTAGQTLAITSGSLRISSAINITPYYGGSFVTISQTTGRLWMNNSSATISSTVSTGFGYGYLDGELRIDSGTVTIGNGSYNLDMGSSSSLKINGGKLTANGGLRQANNSTCIFNMTGGDLVLDPQATASLNNTVKTFEVKASSTFSWSGGTITIVDPHNIVDMQDFSITSGGTKSISGGTLRLGNGTSTSGGGSLGNTSGFGISCPLDLYSMEVNNNTNTTSSRAVRLYNDITLQGNLTIQSNSYLFLGSGTTGATLTVKGNVTNDGTLAGTQPGGTQTIGALTLTGTSGTQTLSGAGSISRINVLTISHTGSGVTFTNSNNWGFGRINFTKGAVNPGSNLTVGTPQFAPTIQLGGTGEAVAGGSVNTNNLNISTTVGNATYIYGATSGSYTTGYEMVAGAQNLLSLTISDADGLTSNRDISTKTLVMSGGNLGMGTQNLTLGSSATNAGTLTYTSGLVSLTSGTFKRWYASGTTPTSTYTYGFPIVSGSNERGVKISSASFSTGGSISVQHNDATGATDINPSFSDGSINVDRRTNTNWVIAHNSIALSSGSLSVKMIGQGISGILSVGGLRFIKSTSAVGTSVNGSGTTSVPEVNRTFSSTNLSSGDLSNTFYIGVNSSVNPLSSTFTAIASGSWSSPSTWDANAVPGSTNQIVIPSPYTVTVSSGSNVGGNVTINNGGGLTISGGSLDLGKDVALSGTWTQSGGNVTIAGSGSASGINVSSTGSLNLSGGNTTLGSSGGGDRTLDVSGTLAVSSNANLQVNGNLNIASGATLSQSDGSITIDGNSGTASSSVAQGTHLVSINTAFINCSGGNLIIVDPPHNSYTAGTTHSLRINTSSSTTRFSGTHTVQFGDGSSTESGNADGFSIDTKRNGTVPLQNVTVNGGNTTGRHVSTSFSGSGYGTHIKGSLTITSGSEFRHTSAVELAIGGDITNDGTMTSAQSLTLGGLGYIISGSQSISGSGTFRNATSSSTASFASVAINSGGVSFTNTNSTYSFSGTLNVGSIVVAAGSNTIKLTSTGSLSRTSGYINGKLSKNYATGTSVSNTFEIGNSSNYLPVTIAFPSVTTAGDVTVSTATGDHAQFSSSCMISTQSINRNWTIANSATAPASYNATVSYPSGDVDAGLTLSNTRSQVYSGSAWSGNASASASSTSATINGLTSFGDLQLGAFTSVPVSVSISTASTSICTGASITFSATPTNGGSSPTYQWKKNGTNVGTNSSSYSDNSLANNDQITCDLTSSSPCAITPTATSNTLTMSVSGGSVGGTISSGSATVCSGATSGTLSLTGNTGSVVRWESSVSPFSTWTAISNTATSYTSGALSQTTQFRVVVQSGSCGAVVSDTATTTVIATSVGGSVSGGTNICSGSTSPLLSLSGHTGSVVRWESSVSPFTSWTTISNTATTYTSGTLSQTTQFRAVVQSGSCATANSSATTVTVDPVTAGGSVSGGATICSGSTSGTLTLSGHTGSVVRWESSVSPFSTWTSISNTGTTYTSGALSQTTQYRAVVQSGTCSAANSTTTTVTVDPATVPGSVSGGSTICAGSNSGTLTLSSYTGTIVRWESSVSPFTSWSSISNTSSTYTSGALSQTTQFRAVVQSGSCASANSSATTVTVNSTSVGGSISGASSVCTGSTSGTLTLSGHTGSVVNWESSVSPFTTWTTISNTATTYTSGSLTQATQFRAVVQSGSCASATSSAITVGIDATTVAGSISGGGSTICAGATSGTLTLSGHTGSVVRWESSVSPFSTWTSISNTSTTYTSGALSQTTQFRAVVQSGACASATTSGVTVTVNPTTVGGHIGGGSTICSGSTSGTLTLSGYTGTIAGWESAVSPYTTWTSISNTASTYTSGALTQTTKYRAILQSGICPSAYSDTATVTVSTTSVAGTLSGGSSICSGSNSGTLTLSGNNGSVVRWESAVSPYSTWTTIGNTATTYTSGALSQTTKFRVVVQSGSCSAAISDTATVTVSSPSVAGSISGASSICQGSTAGTLSLSGNTGSVVNWESSVSPFTTWSTISNTTTSLSPGSPSETTKYRAVVQNSPCASATTASVQVTVSPTTDAGSVEGGSTICSGSTSGVLLLSVHTGTIVRWESSVSPFSTWTSISNTNSTYQSGALTQTTKFRAVVQSGTCAAANSTDTIVTVDPTTVGGSVSGGATVCSGSTSGTLTLSGHTGSVVRWESTVSPFTTWSAISNTATTYTSGSLTQTTRFRAVVKSGACSSANSNYTEVVITPASAGGSVTGGSTICSGSTSGTLTLSGHTGSIVNWESSVSPFTSWTSISNTATTYTSGALSQTTQFRAVVQSGSCATATSTSTTVTVNPASVGGSVSGGSTICSGSTSGTLTLSGNTGSVVRWESSVSPFTSWTSISNTSTTYTSGALTQTTQFRAVVQSGTCATANSSTTTVTVDPPTVAGSVSGGAAICSGSTSGTLTLSGNTGTIVRWESSVSPFSSWTSISNTATTYTSGALTQTTQFRAVVQSGVCASANSATTTVTVDPATVGGSVSGGSTICSGSNSGTLTLSGNTGSIVRWESSVSPFTTWTSISNTATTYTSGALTQTTQFRAVVQSGSCATANSSATTVTVDPPTVAGSVTGGSTICAGSNSGTLTLSGNTGSVVRWESSVSPFTSWTSISNTATTYTSGALTQTTQFRAVVQSGVCASANSSTTTVTVNPATVGGSVSGGSTICSGSTSGTLTLSGHTGSIVNWESSVSPFSSWTTIANTATTYTSGALTQTTQFRAVVQSGTCASASSASTTVNVDPPTVAGSVSGGSTICSGSNSGTLTLSGNTGTVVRWESSVSPFSTWTSISNTSTTYTSGTLTQTTQFRAVVQSGTCASATSTATTVTVNPASAGGSVSGGSTICSGTTSGTLTLSGHTGSIVNWESSVSPFTTWTTIANTSTTYTSGALTQTTQFRAVVQSGTCTSATSTPTTVTVDPASVAGSVTGGSTICAGSNSGTLTLSGNTGNIVRWESAVAPFTSWTSISNTATTYTSGALTETTQFRVIVQSGSCASAISDTVTVNVDPLAVGGTISGGSNICTGSTSGTLTLSGYTGTIVNWESAVAPFTTWTTIANTTDSYTSGALTQTTKFRAIITSGTCGFTFSDSATVTIDPSSVGGTVSGGSTICEGSNSGTLTLSGNTGNVVNWESAVAPFTSWTTIANTATTYTSGALSQTTQFRAVVQSGNCASATSASTTVFVTPASVGGSISGGSAVCSGSTSGTLTLSGHTGSIVNWESSVAPFTTWTTISNTAATYTSGALTQTTQFRAIVQNGVCSTISSDTATVTVDPVSVGGTISGGSTICSGSTSGTLTLSGHTGSIVNWESAVAPFTTWTTIANTATTYTSGALTQTTKYRAIIQSGACSIAISDTATVTVNLVSMGGAVNGGSTICPGSTSGTLILTGYGGSITGWLSSVSPFTSWTAISNTNPTYVSGTLTETTQFKAIVQSGVCDADTSASETVTVMAPSVGGSISGASSICTGSSSGTLSLSGETGTVVYWEQSFAPFTAWGAVGSTAGSTTYTSGPLSQTVMYRAQVQNGSCAIAISDTATVTVNSFSIGGTVSGGSSICPGSNSGVLTLSGENGSVVNWESSVSPFTSWTTIANTATTYTSGALTQETHFRAVVQNGSCASATSSEETVSMTPASVGGTVSGGSTVCTGGSANMLSLTGHTGVVVRWQSRLVSASTWTDIANATPTYSPGTVTDSIYFRAVVQSGTCAEAFSDSTLIDVRPLSIGGAVSGTSPVCAGSTSSLSLSSQNGTVLAWQSSVAPYTSWSPISNTSDTYTSGILAQSTAFRAVVSSGCPPAFSDSFVVEINTPSSGGTLSGGSTICAGATSGVLTLSTYNGNISGWESSVAPFTTWTAISNTSDTYTSGALTATTQFRAIVQNGTCDADTSTIETVTVNPAVVGGTVTGSSPICNGGTSSLYLTGSTGTVVNWESAPAPFTTWSTIANTSTSLTTSALSQATAYRAVLQNGSCPAVASDSLVVDVLSSGVWLGGTNDWNTASNWCGGVPTSTTDVVINAGVSNMPLITGFAEANNITVSNNASIDGDATSEVYIYGNLVLNGNATLNNDGRVQYAGTSPQYIPGSSFYASLEINNTNGVYLTGEPILDSLIFINGKLTIDTNDVMIINGAVRGYDNTRYIVTTDRGRLSIELIGSTGKTGDIVFPVGTSSSYLPITINNATGTADQFWVRVAPTVQDAYPTGASVSSHVVGNTWFIGESTPGGSNATVTFQWNGTDETTNFDRTNARANFYDGTSWNPGTLMAASGSDPYTITVSGLTNFGPNGHGIPYNVDDQLSTLPVKFTLFTANYDGNVSHLNWQTASEVNNARFDVERSIDGKTFAKIGEQAGAGNSISIRNYQFTDAAAKEVFAHSNVIYYRLKQVDFNGNYSYSDIRAIMSQAKPVFEIVTVQPNPFMDKFTLNYASSTSANVSVEITDMFGKTIHSETLATQKGINTFELSETINMKGGVYFVRLIQNDEVRIVRVVKQN